MVICSYSTIDGKTLKFKIDSDDVVKILNGLLNLDTFKNFATQIIQRNVGKHVGYSNPFHPEDDLVSTFNAAIVQEHKRLKQKKKPKTNTNMDSLDKENENFVDDHLSDEAFSDKEAIRMSEVKPNITTILKQITKKPFQAVKTTKNPNQVKHVSNVLVNGRIISRRHGLPGELYHSDDRVNFKPIQKRFMMKNTMKNRPINMYT